MRRLVGFAFFVVTAVFIGGWSLSFFKEQAFAGDVSWVGSHFLGATDLRAQQVVDQLLIAAREREVPLAPGELQVVLADASPAHVTSDIQRRVRVTLHYRYTLRYALVLRRTVDHTVEYVFPAGAHPSALVAPAPEETAHALE